MTLPLIALAVSSAALGYTIGYHTARNHARTYQEQLRAIINHLNP